MQSGPRAVLRNNNNTNKSPTSRPIGNNGIYGVPRRSKFYTEIPSKDGGNTPPVQQQPLPPLPTTPPSPAVGIQNSGRIRRLFPGSTPINYPPSAMAAQSTVTGQPQPQPQQQQQQQQPSFDEIVDEIFKTIGSSQGTNNLDGYAELNPHRRRRNHQRLISSDNVNDGEVLLRNNRVGGVHVLSGGLSDEDASRCADRREMDRMVSELRGVQ